MRREALALAEAGWSVLPLDGKRPCAPLAPHGVDDATSDLAQVEEWWQIRPDANIGARIPEDFIVLDIDPRNGGEDAVARLEAEGFTLPKTLEVLSGRGDGGRHLYYLRPPGEVSRRKVPPGIDVKLKGYMVMPPSRHPDTGGCYSWIERPPMPLSAGLRRLLRQVPPPPVVVPAGSSHPDGLLTFLSRQGAGNRNAALFWVACRLVEAGEFDALADTVESIAREIGLQGTEIAATLASARRTAVADAAS